MSKVRMQTELNSDLLPVKSPSVIHWPEHPLEDLSIKKFEDFSDVRAIATEWDALLSTSETNTVHQLFAWNDVWWQTLSGDRQSFVFALTTGDQMVGVAPLMLSVQRKLGRTSRVLEFIGSGSVNYLDFIAGPNKKQLLETIMEELYQRRAEWDMLNLQHIPETSSTPAIIQEFFKHRKIPTAVVPVGSCPTFICSGDAIEDIKTIKGKKRQRSFNHYLRSGQFEFKICRSMTEIEAYLPAMFDQHIARFSGQARPSKYSDPLQREFVRTMIERLLPMEIPIFAVALFDGQPISIACGFHYAQKFTGYLLTYDEAQSKHSPAKLLIKLLMTEMINKGVTEFDFGRGSAEYKLRFTNCIRENHAALVYSDRFLSVLATIDQTRHQLTDTIKTKIKENHNFQPMVQTYKRISRKIRRLRF